MISKRASHLPAASFIPGLLVFLLTLCVSPVSHAQGTAIATVISYKGTLQVKTASAANFVLAAAQQPLKAGDVIRTAPNGGASLLFADGTQVRLGPSAELRVTPPAQVKGNTSFFELLVGEIWARLRPGSAGQTKYANLVVRGTEIDLAVTETSATLVVLEGDVQFFNDLGSVHVAAGQRSSAKEGQAPTAPVTFENPGLTVEWRLNLDRAQIARDVYFVAPADAAARKLLKGGTTPPQGIDPLWHVGLFFDAGQYDAALAALDELWKNPPRSDSDLFGKLVRLRAETLIRLARGGDAAAFSQDALKIPGLSAPNKALILNGLGWTQLEAGQAADAVTTAKNVLQTVPDDPEANLLLGQALLHSGDRAGAETAFKAVGPAAGFMPPSRPQATAWLALLAEERDDKAAGELAKQAVAENPNSAVAHLAASIVALDSNDSRTAAAQARLAVDLDQDSAAGQLALANVELASGRPAAAGVAAAKATALDPTLAEAHYTLGLADASRRDYPHAERSLRRALELQPDYAPAAAALGRILIKEDRPAAAAAFLADWSKDKPNSSAVNSATGEALFRLAKYDQALEKYRQSTKDEPNSALAWSGFCRAALDANALNEAIHAGTKAVALAPNVAEYHATLGLAYRFSHMDGQADREFRTALALDPQNALALVQLGQAHIDTDPVLATRTYALTSAQGFLLDPGISRDLLRGGTHGYLTPTLGDEPGLVGAARASTDSGKVNLYAEGNDFQTAGYRPNSDHQQILERADVTLRPDSETNVLLRVVHQRDDYGVPGAEITPKTTDDRSVDKSNNDIAGIRRQLHEGLFLWAGLFHSTNDQDRTSPGKDKSYRIKLPPITPIVPSSENDNRALTPEFRLDWRLSRNADRSGQWTLGYAHPRVTSTFNAVLYEPPFLGIPAVFGALNREHESVSNLVYTQYSQKVTPRLQFSAQLRRQTIDREDQQDGHLYAIFPLQRGPFDSSDSRWLPSAVVNYRAADRTNLRLHASRRITDESGSILAPVDSLLFTEPSALPTGYVNPSNDGALDHFQLDIEHYGSSGSLLKLFLFHSSADDLLYDFSAYANTSSRDTLASYDNPYLEFTTLRRTGLGFRHERPLSRHLFSQTGLTYAHTDATYPVYNPLTNAYIPSPFSGQAAPYHPNLTGFANLSYISPEGNKVIATVNYRSRFYQDDQNRAATTRQTFPASATLDLLFAREHTVKNEYYLQIKNVFGSEQIIYRGIRVQPREFIVGWTRRF